MPDKRTHRGPNPKDQYLFAPTKIPILAKAVEDFTMLLNKDYADKSALKLVGDHYNLTQRQRLAVMRVSCSARQHLSRLGRECPVSSLHGQSLVIDGYNLLITIESALSKGLIFECSGGFYKDIASVHGTYRKVNETIAALETIGRFLQPLKIADVLWLLDSPVSNSAKLKTLILDIASQNDWPWRVELLQSPDKEMFNTNAIVATTDSVILDRCQRWVNLAAEIIKTDIPEAKVINLFQKTPSPEANPQ